MAPYGRDLARIHHVAFSNFAHEAAPGVLRLLGQAGIQDGHIVDLGCGSGIWLRALTDAGYRATGVDPSAAMLALARREAPRALFVRASAHDVRLPACDAVTALGEVLGYLPADGRRAPSLARTFLRVARALRPGGLFVFDLFVAGQGRRPLAHRAWQDWRRWALLLDVREDIDARRLVRTITIFRQIGRRYVRRDERHVLQVPTRDEVTRALRDAGFTVRVSRHYGTWALMPRRLAFIARRGSTNV